MRHASSKTRWASAARASCAGATRPGSRTTSADAVATSAPRRRERIVTGWGLGSRSTGGRLGDRLFAGRRRGGAVRRGRRALGPGRGGRGLVDLEVALVLGALRAVVL